MDASPYMLVNTECRVVEVGHLQVYPATGGPEHFLHLTISGRFQNLIKSFTVLFLLKQKHVLPLHTFRKPRGQEPDHGTKCSYWQKKDIQFRTDIT